ncbi:MAG: hypothetical protein ACREE7_10960, partial [Dongiaceae bacterium]
MLGSAFADGDRNARDGLNLHFVAGRVIHDALAVEVNAFATQLDADVAGGPDTDLMGAGANLALGLPVGGHPVFLLGVGAVQQDIGGEKKTATFGDLGVGVYLPFTFGGELWRLDARYHAVMTDHPALPDEDTVEDIRVNLGVFFAFGREEPAPAPPPQEESVPPPLEPAPAVEPAVPPLIVPARVAPEPADTDADDDGVADASDACPGTTRGTKVDAKGCVIPEQLVLRAAYFGSNSASLTAKAYELLHQV